MATTATQSNPIYSTVTINEHRFGHNVVKSLIASKAVFRVAGTFRKREDGTRPEYTDFICHPFFDSTKVTVDGWTKWTYLLDKSLPLRITVINPNVTQKGIIKKVNDITIALGQHGRVYGQAS